MARLSVNLNKVALLRNARHTGVPNLLDFARIVLEGGKVGITVHPRPDERHIRRSDVMELAKFLKPYRPKTEFNIEGYPDERFFEIIREVKPEQVTLVPDAPDVFTSEKGWVIDDAQMSVLKYAIREIKKSCGRVILFVEPDADVVPRVMAIGADGIEIRTTQYAEGFRNGSYEKSLRNVVRVAEVAHAAGLVVNVGHDLNLQNLVPLIARIPFLAEASIGHELTVNALMRGFAQTIHSYAAILAGREASLTEKEADKNPFKQFDVWFKDTAQQPLPNAMVLSTVHKGVPSARTVLLKDFDNRGFTFFTNYGSRKARELQENPNASLLFHWPLLERQVRIVGKVMKVSRAESAAYFKTRPRESQLGAWASDQSSAIKSRTELEEKMAVLKKKYESKPIPLPPHWGGYRVVPTEFEFWQGREGRLHDRLVYTKNKKGKWTLVRLAP